MTGTPDLIAVALRPVLMIAVGAIIYRGAKVVLPRYIAARLTFIGTSALFALELVSIAYPDLLIAPAVATLLGVAMLGLFLRKRAING